MTNSASSGTGASANPAPSQPRIPTLHGLIAELETRSQTVVAPMQLATKIADGPIVEELFNFANDPKDLDRVASSLDYLVTKAKLPASVAETSLKDLLSVPNFYGQFFELCAYGWFADKGVQFDPQVQLCQGDTLNPNVVTIDGKFEVREIYFDIKAMGFHEYVVKKFTKALQSRLPGLVVTVEGSMDAGVKDIERHAFPAINGLAQTLTGGGLAQISALGWTVRASPPKPVVMTVTSQNPYRLAEQNAHYPFKTAGQFTRNKPFLLIFAYSPKFNLGFHVNFAGAGDTTKRALARRAFIQFRHDATPVSRFDGKIKGAEQLKDAAALLSGILFINIATGEGDLFLNPNASHPIRQNHISEIFDFTPPTDLGIDGFEHDNY